MGWGVTGHANSPFTVISPIYTPTGHPTPLKWCTILLSKYVIPGVPPLSPPLAYILAPIFPDIFWHQIVKYIFFPQTWRSVISVDITKACVIHVWYSFIAIVHKFIHKTTEWETFTSNQLNFYFKGGVIIFVSTLIQIPNKLKPTQLLFMGWYNVSISTSVQIPDQFNSYLLGEGVILCLHLHLHFFYIPLPVWTMTYQPLSLAPYPMLSPPLLFKSQSKSVPTYRGREFPKQWQPINVSPLFVHRQWKVYNTVNS